VWAIGAAGAGAADPGWVVIDEIAGQWLTMLALPRPSLPGVIAAFLLFRLLDIAKPGPIGWADRRAGPLAVMGDDLIAGAIGAALLFAVRAAFPGLLD
jgi:phosphatidylglycerophosphatase A